MRPRIKQPARRAYPTFWTRSKPDQLVRIGVEPLRVELFTSIPGVQFQDCYRRRVIHLVDGIPISIISLADLRINKAASGRHRDLDDLEHLQPPPGPPSDSGTA